MTKNYILRLFGVLITAASILPATAQEVKPMPPVVVTSASNVNQSVLRSFNGSFRNAVTPVWYRLNKNYLVKFLMDEQKNTALFRESGKLVYNISYGEEKNLPDDIHKLVTDKYEDYKITSAIHVMEASRSIWIVNLEGLKKLKIARVEDGELEEVGDYDKSQTNLPADHSHPSA